MSSGVTRLAFPGAVSYAMTKGALNALTLTPADEPGARGTTVDSVPPGVVATDVSPWPADPRERARTPRRPVLRPGRRGVRRGGHRGRPGPDDARRVTGPNVDAGGGSSLGVRAPTGRRYPR
ncbi:hypothetical protein ACF9IK_15370 [Kitasatospora hibisci]|uniref:hypothetical protein n=1 Tax=Kitasatospora hibisci TaxID=3369522 RepID=UPI00375427E0